MPSKMYNWIEHQRRHLSPEQFSSWVAGNAKVQAALERIEKVPAAQRALNDIQRAILSKVMGPGVQKASEELAGIEKSSVQTRRATGMLRQSIGSTKAKLYLQSLTAWAGSGPRSGYGRVILANPTKRGVRLHRTSKKYSAQPPAITFAGVSAYANPAKYAHFLRSGRVAFSAGIKTVRSKGEQDVERTGKKMLRDRFTGRFFGHSVKAAQKKDFMAPAAAAVGQAGATATKEMTARLNKAPNS